MNSEQPMDAWGQIVSKAWRDDAFKNRLLSEPSAVLREQGLNVPAGMQIRIVENTEKIVHLTLPLKPSDSELSDSELENVAGGTLSRGLVSDLASVFGWNSQQINQIGNAAGWNSGGGNKNQRSPPTGAA